MLEQQGDAFDRDLESSGTRAHREGTFAATHRVAFAGAARDEILQHEGQLLADADVGNFALLVRGYPRSAQDSPRPQRGSVAIAAYAERVFRRSPSDRPFQSSRAISLFCMRQAFILAGRRPCCVRREHALAAQSSVPPINHIVSGPGAAFRMACSSARCSIVSLLPALGSVVQVSQPELHARRDKELPQWLRTSYWREVFKTTAMRSAVFVAQLSLKTGRQRRNARWRLRFRWRWIPGSLLAWTTSEELSFCPSFPGGLSNTGTRRVAVGPICVRRWTIRQHSFTNRKVLRHIEDGLRSHGGAMGNLVSAQPRRKKHARAGQWHRLSLHRPGQERYLQPGHTYERPFEPVCTVFGYMSLNPAFFPKSSRGAPAIHRFPRPPIVTLRFPTARLITGTDAPCFKHYAVMAALYDIDRDGAAEIVALTLPVRRGDTRLTLRLINCLQAAPILKSQVAVAHQDMAVVIYGIHVVCARQPRPSSLPTRIAEPITRR